MTKLQPKSNLQIRRLFGLAAKPASAAGCKPHDYLSELASDVTRGRTASLAALSFDEANAMIVRLGGDPITSRPFSKRTENYRKQKAGVKSIETSAQIEFIREIAGLRNMSEEGIGKLAAKMHLPWPPNTTEQGNKICEAIKAMNRRDNLVAFPVRTGSGSDRVSKTQNQKPKTTAPAEPSFRRVA